MTSAITEPPEANQKFVRGLGLLDSTMLVAGSMIGSGIFIVSADIGRLVGSPGWLLLVWAVTGALIVTARTDRVGNFCRSQCRCAQRELHEFLDAWQCVTY